LPEQGHRFVLTIAEAAVDALGRPGQAMATGLASAWRRLGAVSAHEQLSGVGLQKSDPLCRLVVGRHVSDQADEHVFEAREFILVDACAEALVEGAPPRESDG
jgi:hypothetical protein